MDTWQKSVDLLTAVMHNLMVEINKIRKNLLGFQSPKSKVTQVDAISSQDNIKPYNTRNVAITFNDSQNFFIITSRDNEPILQGYPAEMIKHKGWVAASDGHGGFNAIVLAPKDCQDELEAFFKDGPEAALTGAQAGVGASLMLREAPLGL